MRVAVSILKVSAENPRETGCIDLLPDVRCQIPGKHEEAFLPLGNIAVLEDGRANFFL